MLKEIVQWIFGDGMTLKKAIDLFLSALVGINAESTLDWYATMLAYLTAFFGNTRPISEITIEELREWRASLYARTEKHVNNPTRPSEAGPLSPWTILGAVKVVRIFFKWLTVEGYLQENPALRLQLPKTPAKTRRGITDRDIERIIEVAKHHVRDLAIVLFLRDTGSRVGGAANLRLSDLNLDADNERMRRQVVVREKGKKERIVFLTTRSLKAMRMWLEIREQYAGPHDRVFCSISNESIGRPITPNGIYQIVRRLAQRAGVDGNYSPHQWRHAYARKLIKGGANLAQVSQILGHSDIHVTVSFYGSLAVDQLQDAHDKYLDTSPPDFEYDED